ncbi:MAG TPA: ZIP family metal transporter [Steroidobacteraceae bacterium]|nr:ZIP family metal transporter [Steroidobacteraceae bacterium]
MQTGSSSAPLIAVIGLTGGVGLASALAASLFIALPAAARRALVPHLVSFATGALLGAALIGFLPAAIAGAGIANAARVGLVVLGGLLVFFVLEKLVLWRHSHDDPFDGDEHDGPRRVHALGPMILWGDAFHNVVDGVVIAAAYLTSPGLGLATALAVFTHELPQEIGDIGILLHSGMGRLRALALNLLVSASAVVGGIVAVYALGAALAALPYALAFAGASLLYVAVADLIPGLHRHAGLRRSVEQFVLILAGVGVIWLTQHHPGGEGGRGLP